MPYEIYKIIHLIGVVLIFSGLVGLLTIKMSGGKLEGKTKSLVFISHGVGLIFALVGGFGLLARLGLITQLPGWVYGKLVIWLILGGATVVIKKKFELGTILFLALILIFAGASYLAVIKPF